jgi:hypothetical protein
VTPPTSRQALRSNHRSTPPLSDLHHKPFLNSPALPQHQLLSSPLPRILHPISATAARRRSVLRPLLSDDTSHRPLPPSTLVRRPWAAPSFRDENPPPAGLHPQHHTTHDTITLYPQRDHPPRAHLSRPLRICLQTPAAPPTTFSTTARPTLDSNPRVQRTPS